MRSEGMTGMIPHTYHRPLPLGETTKKPPKTGKRNYMPGNFNRKNGNRKAAA